MLNDEIKKKNNSSQPGLTCQTWLGSWDRDNLIKKNKLK
jgi:hypothetical protein